MFRYLQNEGHANEFARGNVWISTFGKWRRDEGEPGDAGEGGWLQRMTVLRGGTGDPEFMRRAQSMGLHMTECTNVNLSGAVHERVIEDAWGLCLARKRTRFVEARFGPYCIEITNLTRFMKLLNRCVALKQTGYGGNHVVCGDIKYRPRVFFDGDLPGHAGLYKPEDERRFPEEEEFRLLWEPRRGHPPLTGFLVEDPELARYCERVA